MAITYAVLINSLSTANYGTGAAITGAFTPTAGRQLVAVTGGQENNGVTDPAPSFTVTDSQGLTWTKIGDVGNAANWSHGLVAWMSTAAPAATMTVSFDCGTRNIYRYFYSVFEVQGANGSTSGYVEADTSTTDGAYTKSLGVAPTVDDLSVFARILDSAVTTLSMGAGWTVIADQADSSGGGALAVAVRPSSTSTTVSISDTNVAGVSAAKASDMAFTLVATSSVEPAHAVPVIQPSRAAMAAASWR